MIRLLLQSVSDDDKSDETFDEGNDKGNELMIHMSAIILLGTR